MRPVQLEFCGVNSFSERASIDFTKLLEFGIFGIFGDTGSGKSTILDCIGFALYGNVFRSRSGSIADMINYRADRAFVNFEFGIYYEGRRRTFRVERELKRKNALQKAALYERKEDGSLAALAEGVRDCNAALERIIGLEQKDFEKCIALPQGEFAQFVKAARSERLKLVSRLFDLERYGEGLVKRVNARFQRAQAETELCRARLEPYEAITPALLEERNGEIAQLEQECEENRKRLDSLRKEEARISGLLARRLEGEKLSREREELLASGEEITALESALSRLERAEAVIAEEKELRAAQTEEKEAQQALEDAEQALKRAKAASESAEAWNEEAAEEEITRLTQQEERARAAEEAVRRAEKLERDLEKAREEYAKESKQYAGFSYEEERGKLEEELASLGEGALLPEGGEKKAAYFREEYAQFAKELSRLADRHPAIREDAAPLIGRYEALSLGERSDWERLRAEYERREKRRKELQSEQLALEKRYGGYKAHCQRLQQLQTDGVRLKTELEEVRGGLDASLPSVREVQELLKTKREEKRSRVLARDNARNAHNEAKNGVTACTARNTSANERLLRSRDRLQSALSAGGFSGTEEAASIVRQCGDAAKAKERVRIYREDLSSLEARLGALPAAEELQEGTEERAEEARGNRQACEKQTEERNNALAIAKKQYKDDRAGLDKKRSLEAELSAALAHEKLCDRLKKLFEGNKFMEYAAEEHLQTVASNAGARLLSLTDGRYFLRYEGGFFVGDNFNGGALRAVYTLSGGETFLVSLSLALALSSEICARSLRPIEFFFLDEGFGTLDEHLIDTVMDSLEKLKGEHFSIGIISHVEELKHRIERKLLVGKATEQHGSQIHME